MQFKTLTAFGANGVNGLDAQFKTLARGGASEKGTKTNEHQKKVKKTNEHQKKVKTKQNK